VVALLLPAPAADLCGYPVAVQIDRSRGASMAPPPWLSMTAWFAGMAPLGVAVALRLVRPVRRRLGEARCGVAFASLIHTGFLCRLTAVLVPS
jgi:hypothetical protein